MTVMVIGMHRSGTSAATGVLNLMGIPAGRPRDRLTADTFNRQGYWESVRLRDVNVRVLECLGGDWAGPPPLYPGWERAQSLRELKEAARAAFRAVYPSSPWVWKDPHNCLTLPFWRQIIGQHPVVFVYRDPKAVAASLQRRDGFSSFFALALWERYVRSALVNVAGHSVLVTSYDRLLADPEQWCRVAAAFLEDQGLATKRRVSSVRRFLEAGRRTSANPAYRGVAQTMSPAQTELHALVERLEGPSEVFRPPGLPAATPWAESLLHEHRRAFLDQQELRHQLALADRRILNLRPLARPLLQPARRGLRQLQSHLTVLRGRPPR